MLRERFGERRGAFESADVGDHLVVVGVLVSSFHWLDVAGEFFAEAIDEIGFTFLEFSAGHVAGSFAGSVKKSLGDPLVPAGDKDDFGIKLERVVPLFLEVETMRGFGLFRRRLPFVLVGAPDV